VGWIRLIGLAHAIRPSGWRRLVAPVAVFASLGALAIAYPELLGNGKPVVQLALVGAVGTGLVAVLAVLKPLVTAACLGSGAQGGLFTPTLAFGVLLGSLLGAGWSQIWPGSPAGSYAIVGGAAVLAASMQGPLAAIVLVLELTRHADALMVPVLVAVVEATVLARVLRAPSVYSARIAAGAHTAAGPSGTEAAARAPTGGGAGGGEPGTDFAEVVEARHRWYY
jgi:chloride channel protein, CIC family